MKIKLGKRHDPGGKNTCCSSRRSGLGLIPSIFSVANKHLFLRSQRTWSLFWPPWVLNTHREQTYTQSKHSYPSNKISEKKNRNLFLAGTPQLPQVAQTQVRADLIPHQMWGCSKETVREAPWSKREKFIPHYQAERMGWEEEHISRIIEENLWAEVILKYVTLWDSEVYNKYFVSRDPGTLAARTDLNMLIGTASIR